MAAPGSTHYGYYVISYEFVYVGNRHGNVTKLFLTVQFLLWWFFLVRNTLIAFAAFSILGAVVVFVTSIMLIIALRKVCV